MGRKSTTAMMRIAIAGAGGFANILAQELSQSANPLLVLSTREHPEFDAYDCQVAVVDYHDLTNLEFTLRGVDLVISTIAGTEQLDLIDAARRAHVRCFVPSEFEGAISHRPGPDDPLDNGSSTARSLLQRWSQARPHPMRFTVFSCGVFYERFAPGGLGTYNMGATLRLQDQGSYMLNIGRGTGEIPDTDSRGRPALLALTSAYDVARFVAAAVERGIDNWPPEFRVMGARLTTRRLQQVCSEVRGVEFEVIARPYNEIVSWLQYFDERNEVDRWYFMQHMLQTANGRYNFGEANLNRIVNIEPVGFREWLQEVWGPAQ
ncbi:hypothetical protein DL766_004111 [Monosporascus sp. MC13-8B]|uniref:NmrA-like domain-containing protein n=1 Tax=Monosporascus cannonballus TaxID=155416 RepID=A0ABY0HMM5_9PEZI|nr:hypothetical protein DL762_000804 [Monosporascus cannonballus]RYO96377.1 hypothetical protein DL763_003233 [Monosporascus cannonballus]RYP32104.1 hypothetical protein DL766_004111 [Monosporascus sp. MC13-8B]